VHDVFISYSSKDKPVADATCATLEAKGIRCWIAPRDIRPGADWGEAIVDAIHEARVFVLVFSRNANDSPQIKREVERAINKGIPVIPLRIENVMPAKALEYFLSTPHWLDAFSPPLEQHLAYLAAVVQSVLDGKPAPQPAPRPDPVAMPGAAPDRRLLIGGGLGAAALAGAGYFLFGIGRPQSFVGSWTAQSIAIDPGTPSPFAPFSINKFFNAVVDSNKLTGSLAVDDVGSFKFTWGGDDTGTVTSTGGNGITLASDLSHQATPFTYILMPTPPPQLAPSLGGKPSDAALILNTLGTGQSILMGNSSGPGIVGHWYTDTPSVGPIDAIQTSLDVTPDGRYHYRFRFSEAGTFEAKDGKWTRTRPNTLPVTGTYKFDGGDRVTAAGGGGVTVWVRS
jgi:hypothetical protein